MLPVYLLDALHGVGGQRGVDGYARHRPARQVVDHVVDGLGVLVEAGLGLENTNKDEVIIFKNGSKLLKVIML